MEKVKPTDDWIIQQARDQYEDEGTLDIDDNPIISRGTDPEDSGAYVQAWVWVDYPEDKDDI